MDAAGAARDAAVTAAGEAEAALRDARARRSGAEAEIARIDGELTVMAERAATAQRELETAQQTFAALDTTCLLYTSIPARFGEAASRHYRHRGRHAVGQYA